LEPLNNNNRGNNRRRGRGNRQQGGGGQQLNRIDSRARGNAPQLLEKYRKLAHDAHLNGDRVQAEYYLQFADHYFRVIADARTRQEEQRNRPQGERWESGADEGEDNGEFSGDTDFPSFDQPSYPRREREERPRPPRQDAEERFGEDDGARSDDEGESEAASEANPYEPPENPFVSGNRGPRAGLRPRRGQREERDSRPPRAEPREEGPAGLDPASLPPSIGAARDEEAEAKPRRGRPRKKPTADDAGEALESVG
jgi:hypothetical protein